MALTFHAQILTPDGTRFDGDVIGVQVPGTRGSFEMQVNHAPIISTLEIGHIRLTDSEGENLYYAVSGGFVEMNNNRVSLLAEAAEKVDEIDVERARSARERALEMLDKKKSDRDEVRSALKRAENRLKLVEEKS